jgi:integrase
MAGTVRKRTWTTRQGETNTAWVADYFDQHRKRHTRQFSTKRGADAWLTRTKVDVASGIHTPDADSITVKEAAELWLSRRETQLLERGTLRVYHGYAAHILPRLGRVKLSRLTTPMVEAFADTLARELSWHRARMVLAALKMLLKNAQRRGFVQQNVALPVRIVADERSQRPLAVGADVPTVAEMRAILDAFTGYQRPRFMMLAFTGLRAGELRGLTWSDIDFGRALVIVRQRADLWGDVGNPKSRNSYREVPMIPRLVNTLKEWQLACPPASDLVFPGITGRPLNHTSLQTAFLKAQRAAGVLDATGRPKYGRHIHALRHFFASWEIGQHAPPKRLQQLMGHGSIQMTYDVYGHWLADIEDDHARFAAGEAAVFGSAAAQS